MKLKGVSVFEQHVDKIVLAAVAVVLLAVLAMQFLLEPNRITVGAADKIRPQNAYEPVKDEAVRVLAQVRNPEPQTPEVPEQTLLGAYERLAAADLAPVARVAAMGPAVDPGGSAEGAGLAETRLAMPELPAPAAVVASAYRGTVSPAEWVLHPELRSVLPAEQPFDLSAITVQATMDGRAVYQALLADPDGDAGPLSGLPVSWWNNTFEVLGVELERQTALADGSWSEPVLVEPMPGRMSLLGEARAQRPDVSTLVAMVDEASARMPDVVQPEFYSIIAGPEWAPPAVALAALQPDAAQEQADRLVRSIASWTEQIRRIDANRAAELERGRQRETSNRGGEGGGGRGLKGGGGGDDPRERSTQRENDEPDRAAGRIGELETQIERAYTQLAELGFDEDGRKIEVSLGEDVGPLFQSEALTLWAHDVAPPDGGTFRYRVRPVFNNPVYGRGLALGEDQQPLAADPLLPGPWSEWTYPVQTLSSQYFFVTNARESGPLGGGPQASVELYRFYYGFYRQAGMSAEPGDALVERASVPEGLVAFDLAKLEQEIGSGGGAGPTLGRPGPQDLGRDPRGPSRPGEEAEESRGPKGASPIRDERDPRSAARPSPAAPAAGQAPDSAEGTPVATSVTMDLGVMLLDVSRIPGGAEVDLAGQVRDRFQALFRDADGGVLLRIPELDEASLVYRQVAASAALGRLQLRPEEEPTTPAARPTEERAPRPSRDSGGGGGGGGN